MSVSQSPDRFGQASDYMMALMAAIIDQNLPDAADAKRILSTIKINSRRLDWAQSPGTPSGCNGTFTPTDSYCGNVQWMIFQRPRIDGLVVTPGSSSASFAFVAPTGDGARVAVTNAASFTDSRDSSDIAAACNGRSCKGSIGGLTSATTYRYRITAGAMGGTARVEGLFRTE